MLFHSGFIMKYWQQTTSCSQLNKQQKCSKLRQIFFFFFISLFYFVTLYRIFYPPGFFKSIHVLLYSCPNFLINFIFIFLHIYIYICKNVCINERSKNSGKTRWIIIKCLFWQKNYYIVKNGDYPIIF